MTLEQLAAFALMVAAVTIFLEGYRLLRVIAYLFAWQALTPVRAWYIDLPLLIAVLAILEMAWYGFKVGFICWLFDKKPIDILIILKRT